MWRLHADAPRRVLERGAGWRSCHTLGEGSKPGGGTEEPSGTAARPGVSNVRRSSSMQREFRPGELLRQTGGREGVQVIGIG